MYQKNRQYEPLRTSDITQSSTGSCKLVCVVPKVDGSRGEGVGDGGREAGGYEDGIEVGERNE